MPMKRYLVKGKSYSRFITLKRKRAHIFTLIFNIYRPTKPSQFMRSIFGLAMMILERGRIGWQSLFFALMLANYKEFNANSWATLFMEKNNVSNIYFYVFLSFSVSQQKTEEEEEKKRDLFYKYGNLENNKITLKQNNLDLDWIFGELNLFATENHTKMNHRSMRQDSFGWLFVNQTIKVTHQLIFVYMCHWCDHAQFVRVPIRSWVIA